MIVPFAAIAATSELIASHPLGNPDHPTGSSVQVREPSIVAADRFVVGVKRGETWQPELTFADRPPAELFAAGMRAGMNWTPRP